MRWLLPALLLPLLAAACTSGGETRDGLYLALGDSLSAGVGASDPSATAFVPLVRESLGQGVELLNLGHSGDTSQQLLTHGHLDRAVAEIQERNGDADPDNDVRLITLEIGGNDLLGLFFSLVLGGTCPSLQASLEREECRQRLSDTLADYEPNLSTALDRLREAAPGVPLALLTLSNPFSGSTPLFAKLADLALEGMPDTPFPQGLNDIIRAQARERGLILVDLYPLFQGRADQLIAGDMIHPNDQGYRVMAEAVIEALESLP